jgi:hypothetical protein
MGATTVQSDSTVIFMARAYSYTGNVQTFTAPSATTYKLEVWGAQGGDANFFNKIIMTAGKGGYARGNKTLAKNNNIYIVVGKSGGTSNKNAYHVTASYNGGGGAYGRYQKSDGELFSEVVGGGGGATHIATSNRGELKNYEAHQSEVLIVAGGGGGGMAHRYPDPVDGAKWCGYGGAGGGATGIVGTVLVTGANQRSELPTAGSQTSGGIGYNNQTPIGTGGFGYGFDYSSEAMDGRGAAPGGGGGWYGGGASEYGASAGGSGHIGNVQNGQTIAGNQSIPSPTGGTETGHSGNGYCKITWHPTL